MNGRTDRVTTQTLGEYRYVYIMLSTTEHTVRCSTFRSGDNDHVTKHVTMHNMRFSLKCYQFVVIRTLKNMYYMCTNIYCKHIITILRRPKHTKPVALHSQDWVAAVVSNCVSYFDHVVLSRERKIQRHGREPCYRTPTHFFRLFSY